MLRTSFRAISAAWIAVFVWSSIGSSWLCAADATATKIGNPIWEPAGFVLYSSPFGQDTDFSDFFQSQQSILPPPHHSFNPDTGAITPGAPHAGPYDGEMLAGVNASGFKHSTTFNVDDFSGHKGVTIGFMFVPSAGAPTGSSPDYASGPVIPNSLYPMHQSGLTTRNGMSFDSAWDFDILDVNAVVLPGQTTNYSGWSHQPIFEGEVYEFGPGNTPVTGSYSTTINYLDQTGNGWSVTWNYTVVPEPTALSASLVTGCLAAVVQRRRVRS